MQYLRLAVQEYLVKKWPRYRLKRVMLSIDINDRVDNIRVLARADSYLKIVHKEVMARCDYFSTTMDINHMLDIVIMNLGKEYRRIEHYSRTSLKALYITIKKMRSAKDRFNE